MAKTIFVVKKIITMDSANPFATHVAVDDNKIVGVGSSEVVQLFPDFVVNEQFKDQIILPGFIEAHSHSMAGQDGLAPFVGYFDRPSPEGTTLKGLKSVDEVISYLSQVDKSLPPNEPILSTGFDPIYFDGPRFSKVDLDKVSKDRMIFVLHASGHVVTVNSKVLAALGEKLNGIEGVIKDSSGQPNGELQELKAALTALSLIPAQFAKFSDPSVLLPRYFKLAKLAGVTTIADMGVSLNLDDEKQVEAAINLTANSPVRLVPMYLVPTSNKKPEEMVPYVQALEKRSTDRVKFGRVKFIADGSLQAFTGRVKQPYVNGTQNGLWNMDPAKLNMFTKLFNDSNIQINCHCNGDEASEAFINAVSQALISHPWPDNRHTVQHSQLVDEAQFQSIKKLGMCANIFSNHIYYWGDQHRDKILGVERANRMDAANTALSLGVPFSIHCDANVTPIGPLFNIWCAVNRLTASGKVLGEQERIPVEDALYAMTQGAAYLLKLDHEIGSIAVGKIADFTVLSQDPYSVDPKTLKDISVVATVFGGEVMTK